jgi:hypothetical protein
LLTTFWSQSAGFLPNAQGKLVVICPDRWQFLDCGSPHAISSARCRQPESQRFPIAEQGQTKKTGEQSKATPTSMRKAAIICGSKTDIHSHISRVYLWEYLVQVRNDGLGCEGKTKPNKGQT